MVKVSASRLIKAPQENVWSRLASIEHSPSLAPLSAVDRVISHPIVSEEGSVIDLQKASYFTAAPAAR